MHRPALATNEQVLFFSNHTMSVDPSPLKTPCTVPSSSPRLEFRTWNKDDFLLAMSLWGDPRVTALIGGPFSEEAVQERLDRHIGLLEQHGIQYWPMFLKETGEFVGCCGLQPREQPSKTLELGYHLCFAHWGKGLATEAGTAVMKHAFEILGASQLFAGHHPNNESSKKVIVNLGMRYGGHEFYPPTKLDHPFYIITADEFSSLTSCKRS